MQTHGGEGSAKMEADTVAIQPESRNSGIATRHGKREGKILS